MKLKSNNVFGKGFKFVFKLKSSKFLYGIIPEKTDNLLYGWGMIIVRFGFIKQHQNTTQFVLCFGF